MERIDFQLIPGNYKPTMKSMVDYWKRPNSFGRDLFHQQFRGGLLIIFMVSLASSLMVDWWFGP